MKRQELLRQLDQEVDYLKARLADLSQRLTWFKEQEEKRKVSSASILNKQELIKKGDVLITQSGVPITVHYDLNKTVEVWQQVDPNMFIVIRPARQEE